MLPIMKFHYCYKDCAGFLNILYLAPLFFFHFWEGRNLPVYLRGRQAMGSFCSFLYVAGVFRLLLSPSVDMSGLSIPPSLGKSKLVNYAAQLGNSKTRWPLRQPHVQTTTQSRYGLGQLPYDRSGIVPHHAYLRPLPELEDGLAVIESLSLCPIVNNKPSNRELPYRRCQC